MLKQPTPQTLMRMMCLVIIGALFASVLVLRQMSDPPVVHGPSSIPRDGPETFKPPFPVKQAIANAIEEVRKRERWSPDPKTAEVTQVGRAWCVTVRRKAKDHAEERRSVVINGVNGSVLQYANPDREGGGY